MCPFRLGTGLRDVSCSPVECVVVFALPIKCVTIIVVTPDKWRKEEGASISAFHQKSELCDRFSPFKQMLLLLFLNCYCLLFNYFLSRRLSRRWPRACLFSAQIVWNRGNPTERSNHRKQKKRSFLPELFLPSNDLSFTHVALANNAKGNFHWF